jgi:hypothetical protein
MTRKLVIDIDSFVILRTEFHKICLKIHPHSLYILTKHQELIRSGNLKLKFLYKSPSSPKNKFVVKNLPFNIEYYIAYIKIINLIFSAVKLQVTENDFIQYKIDGDRIAFDDNEIEPKYTMVLSSNRLLQPLLESRGCLFVCCFAEAEVVDIFKTPRLWPVSKVYIDTDYSILDCVASSMRKTTILYEPVVACLVQIKERSPQAIFVILTSRIRTSIEDDPKVPKSTAAIKQKLKTVGIDVSYCLFANRPKIELIAEDYKPDAKSYFVYIEDNAEDLAAAKKRACSANLSMRIIQVHRQGGITKQLCQQVTNFVVASKSQQDATVLKENFDGEERSSLVLEC